MPTLRHTKGISIQSDELFRENNKTVIVYRIMIIEVHMENTENKMFCIHGQSFLVGRTLHTSEHTVQPSDGIGQQSMSITRLLLFLMYIINEKDRP